jgi:hypothetical protein
MQRMGQSESVVTSVFSLIIAMGSLTMVASLCGLGGACCAVRSCADDDYCKLCGDKNEFVGGLEVWSI